MANHTKEVLVIGGGYAGIALLNRLKKCENLNLTLIDKSKYHLLQTHLHKYLSGYYNFENIGFNHEKYCKANNITFIHDEVNNINYSKNYVNTKEQKIYRYDYLVIATGSRAAFPSAIENIMEYAKDIKDIDSLNFYRDKFLKLLDSNPQNISITIVGGGLSGVQVACELSYTIKKRGFNKNQIKVTIIEAKDTILPTLDEHIIKNAVQRCNQLDIEILTNSFVKKIFADTIILKDNQEIKSDMNIFLLGYLGNNIVHNSLSKSNQIAVNEYYQIGDFKNAFAIGDVCIALDTKTQKPQEATAQNARMQAELIAKNILLSIEQKELVQNGVSNKGVLVDLGGPFCATGKLFGINLYRNLAVIIKKFVYILHTQKFNS